MKIPLLSILVILAVIGGVYYFYNQQFGEQSARQTETVFPEGQFPAGDMDTQPSSMDPNSPTSSETAGEPITLAELSLHNTPDDCWIAVQGNVYDMSGFGDQHPGGAEALYANCGTDGTEAFLTRGGFGPHPETALQALGAKSVGELVQ